MELLSANDAQILTGDGAYDEQWASPSRWRREVTLGSYRAIEVESGGIRKMQATSDYIPSRIVMLMESLLNPISRYDMSPELSGHTHWKKTVLKSRKLALIRFAAPAGHTNLMDIETSYLFDPAGVLVQSNESDIVTTWDDDILFHGKVFSRHMRVQADGSRDLLTAALSIEPLGNVSDSAFNLPGPPADAGTTLRPIGSWMIHDLKETVYPPVVNDFETLPDLLIRINITREGYRRDVEIISMVARGAGSQLPGAAAMLASARQARYHPGTIDGSRCQVAWEQFATPSTDTLANHWDRK